MMQIRKSILFHLFVILVAQNGLGADPKASAVRNENKYMSLKQKRALCQKLRGRYIAFFSLEEVELYQVVKSKNNCMRRRVAHPEKLMKSGVAIQDVPSAVIRAFPLMAAAEVKPKGSTSLKKYEGKFVTSPSYEEVYKVSGNKLFRYPELETYIKDAGSLSKRKTSLFVLSAEEIAKAPKGGDLPSVFNDGQIKMMQKEVEVWPIDRACKSVKSGFVTYLAGIFYIEKVGSRCFRRPTDPSQYTRRNPNAKLKELDPVQAASIPLGAEYKLGKR